MLDQVKIFLLMAKGIWHLCIVTAQHSVNGNCVLIAWSDSPLTGKETCICTIGTAFLFTCLYVLFFCASCPIVSWSKITNTATIWPVFSSGIKLATEPIAPFVSPSATSMLVVIITHAPTFKCKSFCKFPVPHGFSGRIISAN